MLIDALAIQGVEHLSFGRLPYSIDLPSEAFDGGRVAASEK